MKELNDELEKLEVALTNLLQPYLTEPSKIERLEADNRNQELCRQLWITLNGGGEIIMGMQRTLQDPYKTLKPRKSVKTFIALKTGLFQQFIVENIDALAPEFDKSEFGAGWVRQAYTLWKDKLAGLYLQNNNWEKMAIQKDLRYIGILTGREWLKLLTIYLNQKKKHIEKLP